MKEQLTPVDQAEIIKCFIISEFTPDALQKPFWQKEYLTVTDGKMMVIWDKVDRPGNDWPYKEGKKTKNSDFGIPKTKELLEKSNWSPLDLSLSALSLSGPEDGNWVRSAGKAKCLCCGEEDPSIVIEDPEALKDIFVEGSWFQQRYLWALKKLEDLEKLTFHKSPTRYEDCFSLCFEASSFCGMIMPVRNVN